MVPLHLFVGEPQKEMVDVLGETNQNVATTLNNMRLEKLQ